jgi:Helix-turn-helix domain
VTELDAFIQSIARQIVGEVRRQLVEAPVMGPMFGIAVGIEKAATYCDVSDTTMRDWIKRGIVPTSQMEPGARRLVRIADLDQALRDHQVGGRQSCQPSEALPAPKTKGRQLQSLEGGRT